MTWEIRYFHDSRGKNVVEDVLMTLQPKGIAAAKIQTIINLHIKNTVFFKSKGNAFHKIEEFWQIRASNCRVLGKQLESSRTFVLLHAFVKKVDKTPIAEIEKARANWNEYLETVCSELNYE